MDIRKVKKLIELMEESDITEIEIKEGDDSVRVSRASSAPTPKTTGSTKVNQTDVTVVDIAKDIENSPTAHIVTAPMVGTFYRSPSPDASPFIEIGVSVEIGETLCIIESMKMMNQIKSDRAGIIESILVENEAVVEFGQAIFTIS